MNARILLVAGFLIVASASCAPSHEKYLDNALNEATEDDVAEELGPPEKHRELENGNSVWVYRMQSHGENVSYGDGPGSASCEEYQLTFDTTKTLREWERRKC
jgi:hypothetical protein